MRSPRFLVVVVLLLATAAVLGARGDVDRVPSSAPLTGFPIAVGSWSGTEIPLDADVLDVLGKGYFLNRVYVPDQGTHAATLRSDRDTVGLFIGYFPTQRSGQSIHSPQHCLPGAGWVFESSGETELTEPGGKTLRVGEYLISDGNVKDEVLYWYRSHGRDIANDYVAKVYTLVDAIRYSRTDAALVRVVTPLRSGESRQDAHQRAVDFAERISPLLSTYVPD